MKSARKFKLYQVKKKISGHFFITLLIPSVFLQNERLEVSAIETFECIKEIS